MGYQTGGKPPAPLGNVGAGYKPPTVQPPPAGSMGGNSFSGWHPLGTAPAGYSYYNNSSNPNAMVNAPGLSGGGTPAAQPQAYQAQAPMQPPMSGGPQWVPNSGMAQSAMPQAMPAQAMPPQAMPPQAQASPQPEWQKQQYDALPSWEKETMAAKAAARQTAPVAPPQNLAAALRRPIQ